MGKDDGSNVSLSGDTKHKRGKNVKDEHMPVDAKHLSNSVDNRSAESRVRHHWMVEDDIIARGGWTELYGHSSGYKKAKHAMKKLKEYGPNCVIRN